MVMVVDITRNLNLACDSQPTCHCLCEVEVHCFVPAVRDFLSVPQEEARLGFAFEYLPKDTSICKADFHGQ